MRNWVCRHPVFDPQNPSPHRFALRNILNEYLDGMIAGKRDGHVLPLGASGHRKYACWLKLLPLSLGGENEHLLQPHFENNESLVFRWICPAIYW